MHKYGYIFLISRSLFIYLQVFIKFVYKAICESVIDIFLFVLQYF